MKWIPGLISSRGGWTRWRARKRTPDRRSGFKGERAKLRFDDEIGEAYYEGVELGTPEPDEEVEFASLRLGLDHALASACVSLREASGEHLAQVLALAGTRRSCRVAETRFVRWRDAATDAAEGDLVCVTSDPD